MDLPSVVAVVIGVVSIVVAAFAVVQSHTSNRESRENFDKTKDVLADIDKKAELIERIVAEHQRELMDTVRSLVLPQKPDMGEQIGMEFMKIMMQDPEKAKGLVEMMKSLPTSEE